ncbi:ROK family glucokinase [Virgibacillus sp. NKC19-16]|uniref:ROK family glucokinase n=1 Tax=Virgibacillus salidurans TaxID=2831673 RepID=UPI001F23A3D8|nr:ROK family glucokinase [Virgibacillus sp. NKC19-16]UJL44847.1 ROK family glucokinase [Virgibacillus sp. NKC19-16]
MNKIIIGVDIGGTTVKIGFINDSGEILNKWEIPTNKSNAGMSIIDDIWQSIRLQLTELNLDTDMILGIGVGAPGFIDGDNGFVYEAVNIGWENFELAKQLKDKSEVPVFVENDANIAVLGENWKGAGNQARNVIAITLGTGVGGGIIANGAILNGENGMAGEIGHTTIDPKGYLCNCGRKGCLETIASATGIARQAMDKVKNNPTSTLADHYRQTGTVSAKDVFDLAKNGDTDCKHIIHDTADTLGLFIANMGTTINPSKVLIGGGVSKAGDQLLREIKNAFHKYALPRVSNICEIKIAQLGNDAGIIGGAFFVKQKLLDITF